MQPSPVGCPGVLLDSRRAGAPLGSGPMFCCTAPRTLDRGIRPIDPHGSTGLPAGLPGTRIVYVLPRLGAT